MKKLKAIDEQHVLIHMERKADKWENDAEAFSAVCYLTKTYAMYKMGVEVSRIEQKLGDSIVKIEASDTHVEILGKKRAYLWHILSIPRKLDYWEEYDSPSFFELQNLLNMKKMEI